MLRPHHSLPNAGGSSFSSSLCSSGAKAGNHCRLISAYSRITKVDEGDLHRHARLYTALMTFRQLRDAYLLKLAWAVKSLKGQLYARNLYPLLLH